MTREQIIEILETWDDYVLGGDINDDIADAILALPLNVPSDEERRIWRIHDKTELIEMEVATSGELMERLHGRDEGMDWMREEIIKRNK